MKPSITDRVVSHIPLTEDMLKDAIAATSPGCDWWVNAFNLAEKVVKAHEEALKVAKDSAGCR